MLRGHFVERSCPYRWHMSQFPESTFPVSREGPSFLSLLGIATILVTAGVGIALLIAAGG